MKLDKESYFIRHVGIVDSEILFKNKKIAIHYGNIASTDPDKYPKGPRSVIKRFVKLAHDGGYVWAQYKYGDVDKVLVGFIDAGSKIKFEGKENLKTLRLKKVREVKMGQLMSMRAGVPREGTFVGWRIVKNRLSDLVKKRPAPMIWDSLSHSQQETVCAEFLRHPRNALRLQYLLLPVGRTMKDVDIYGVTSQGSLLFGQVTFSSSRSVIFSKVISLEKYKSLDRNNKLIFFSPQDDRAFYKELIAGHSEIKFVPTDEVFGWLKTNPHLMSHLFL